MFVCKDGDAVIIMPSSTKKRDLVVDGGIVSGKTRRMATLILGATKNNIDSCAHDVRSLLDTKQLLLPSNLGPLCIYYRVR